MTNAADRRSVRELLAAMSSDLVRLVSLLFGIASAEGRVAAGAARDGAVVATVGAGLLIFGVMTLVCALVLAMVALGLAPWAAALVVGVALVLGGGIAVHVGVDMVRQVRLHFPETRDALAEGLTWLKNLPR